MVLWLPEERGTGLLCSQIPQTHPVIIAVPPRARLGWVPVGSSVFPAPPPLANLRFCLAYLHRPTWRFLSHQNRGLGGGKKESLRLLITRFSKLLIQTRGFVPFLAER